MEVISRYEAYYQNRRYFFVPELCRHGHLSPRYVTNGICIRCHQTRLEPRKTDPVIKQRYNEYMNEYDKKLRRKSKLDSLTNDEKIDYYKEKHRVYAHKHRLKNLELYGVPYLWMAKQGVTKITREGDKLDHYREYQREYHREYRKRMKEKHGVGYKWMLDEDKLKDEKRTKEGRTPEQQDHYRKYQREYHKKRRAAKKNEQNQ